MIKLPNIKWFIGLMNFRGEGNIYSGSVGCDPYYGDFGKDVFRYRVWIERDDDGSLVLKAVNYRGNNSYDETDGDAMQKMDFEATQDGVDKAQSWLTECSNV